MHHRIAVEPVIAPALRPIDGVVAIADIDAVDVGRDRPVAVEVGRGDLLENRAENAVEIIIALLGDIRRIGILDHNLDHSRLLEQATSLAISSRSLRSEEHTSELQSLMRISYAVFCLHKKNN